MLLRSTIDKVLPVRPDEQEFTKEAREYVFRGNYLFLGGVVKVQADMAWSRYCDKWGQPQPKSLEKYPYWHTVVRANRLDDTNVFTANGYFAGVYEDAGIEATAEINNPAGLSRATRVEKIARRVKVAAAILLASAAGYGADTWTSHQRVQRSAHAPASPMTLNEALHLNAPFEEFKPSIGTQQPELR